MKIRGTASHIAEKYIQLARDSQSSGDPVAAENYYQHAEHYFRLIAAAQEQFRQQNPYYNAQPQAGQSGAQGAADDIYDDERRRPALHGPERAGLRAAAASAAAAALSAARRAAVPAARSAAAPARNSNLTRSLRRSPATSPFRTRTPCRPSSPAAQPQPNAAPNANQGYGQNGHEQGDRPDRFGHRRRRRHRGGGYRPDRPDNFGNANPQGAAPQPMPSDGGDEPRQPD